MAAVLRYAYHMIAAQRVLTFSQMWCTHCGRAFWWETAAPVVATPPRKITRAQKKKEVPPPPYYMIAECELDRMARIAREEEARNNGEGSTAVAAAA